MPKPSDGGASQREALNSLLGLGSHSARKSHYPELLARLEDLETERNRYKWLFEHAVHGIFQASVREGLLAANPALARMLGYDDPCDVLLSLNDLARDLVVGGPAEVQHMRAVLRDAPGLFNYETRLRRKDGRIIDVMMNLLLKPDRQGVFEGFVADITERKQAQQRLVLMNEELEARVSARTAELQEANANLQRQILERERIELALRDARDAAEEANRSKDKYLAATSHDLLQPLNAARLLISTLRERPLPAPEKILVERSHQALEGAEDLLTDLLDIARLDQAAIKPDIDVYTLDELLAPLASEFQPVAEAAGLGLRVRLGHQLIRTDFRLLTRILRNLLSNACRYTEQGGVLLGVRARGDSLELQVWDTGRGIASHQIGEIFQAFNQLDIGHSTARKGVGLGLAIVDRIARILGYPLTVRSQPGRGSVFSIRVPVASEQRVRKVEWHATPAPVVDPLPGRRLLVIDNEPSILHSMQALLEQWGCRVVCAPDQATAVRELQGLAPDMILADFHLENGMRGCEAVAHLRDLFGVRIPAVMITADRSDSCRGELQRLGMPLLNKPVKPGKLRAVISQLLGETSTL
jgi:PAS domain S-box-containing protein